MTLAKAGHYVLISLYEKHGHYVLISQQMDIKVNSYTHVMPR